MMRRMDAERSLEDEIRARLRARGLECDDARARRLRAVAGSLFARLAAIGAALPREAAPPPLGSLDRGSEARPAPPGREP
jgi:hypothetical protein